MRNLIFVLIILTLHGCTYHSQSENSKTPMTYQGTPYRSADSIGLLRRLVIMPIVHEPYKGKYKSLEDEEIAAQGFQEACANYLVDIKGYEILVIKDLKGKWVSNHIESFDEDNLNNVYLQWHEESAGKHTAQIIKKVGKSLNVDGVVVVWVKEREGWSVIDGLLNITLMNAPLFYNLSLTNIGVWIYQTSSGGIVWSMEQATEPGQETYDILLTNLLVDLDNAVPKQLTK